MGCWDQVDGVLEHVSNEVEEVYCGSLVSVSIVVLIPDNALNHQHVIVIV